MKKQLIYSTSIIVGIVLFFSLYSCKNTGNVTLASGLPVDFEEELLTGIIVADVFVDKGGREHPEIVEYYFLYENGQEFIKLSESTGIADNVIQFKNVLVKAQVEIHEGLWDTNDPNVQSRVGKYFVITNIVKIGMPESISFADGNGNNYNFSPNRFIYDPVTPEESSSGVYSGGKPVDKSIDLITFQRIVIKAYALVEKTNLHIDSRIMGSGALTISFAKSTKTAIIKDCDELSNFVKELKVFVIE